MGNSARSLPLKKTKFFRYTLHTAGAVTRLHLVSGPAFVSLTTNLMGDSEESIKHGQITAFVQSNHKKLICSVAVVGLVVTSHLWHLSQLMVRMQCKTTTVLPDIY